MSRRRIMNVPYPPSGSILYLGIDDFSFRRGCRFGTILVNLESRRVVDLLPDREADTSAAWMRQHPDLKAVSRDRGGAYASAAAQGAPQATQCAERFHMIKNLGEAVEDLLTRHLSASRKRQVEAALEEQTPAWQETRQPRRSRTPEEGLSPYQQDRLARYQQMIQLHKQGMTQGALAQQIGVSLNTVRRWLISGCPETTRGLYVSRLDPYLPYLFQRWAQGCHNIAQLFRELEARGYRGSYASVHDNLVRRLQFGGRKTSTDASSKTPPLPTPRQAAFLFLRRPEKLRVDEQEMLAQLRQIHSEIDLAYDLIQQFARMLRNRTGYLLDTCLTQVASTKLPELQSFAYRIA